MKNFYIFLVISLAFTAIFCKAEPVLADIEQAKSLYSKGAYEDAYKIFSKHKDDREAKYYLGVMLLDGRAKKLDQELSIKLIEQSAEAKFPKAQLYLGYLYEIGKGLPKDLQKASSLYWEAAKAGNPIAQFNLAVAYRQGRGVAQSNKRAVELYRQASKCYIPAKNNLAYMLQVGIGVEKNIEEAIALYKEAAQANYAPAQYNLAITYVTGEAGEQSFVEALKWFDLAARQGHKKALQRRDALKKVMEPDEIQSTALLMLDFRPSPPPNCPNN